MWFRNLGKQSKPPPEAVRETYFETGELLRDLQNVAKL
jgi:hypothetical protein